MAPFENLGDTSDSYSHLIELDFLGNDPQIKNSNTQVFYSESKDLTQFVPQFVPTLNFREFIRSYAELIV